MRKKDPRKLETFKIEVITDDRDGVVRPFEDMMPVAENLVNTAAVDDLMHAFTLMASDLGGHVCMTRRVHVWCIECSQYIGYREFEYVKKRFSPKMMLDRYDSEVISIKRIDFRCKTCGTTTSVTYTPVDYSVY